MWIETSASKHSSCSMLRVGPWDPGQQKRLRHLLPCRALLCPLELCPHTLLGLPVPLPAAEPRSPTGSGQRWATYSDQEDGLGTASLGNHLTFLWPSSPRSRDGVLHLVLQCVCVCVCVHAHMWTYVHWDCPCSGFLSFWGAC